MQEPEIITVDCENIEIHLFLYERDERLDESKIYDREKRYWYRLDPPHIPGVTQYHLHGYRGRNEIFSVNQDGTSHDGWQGRIPNAAYERISYLFRDWHIQQIVESIIDKCSFDDFYIGRIKFGKDPISSKHTGCFSGYIHIGLDSRIFCLNGDSQRRVLLVEGKNGGFICGA